MTAQRSDDVVTGLLEQAGLGGAFTLEPCDIGGNNRVSAVRTKDGTFLAKWYFASAEDNRDRLDSEWRFLNYARNIGIDCVPAPLAADRGNNVALYDFINGIKLGPGEVGTDEVAQAADFFCALNASGAQTGSARDLPDASEACFSIDQHLALLDGRFARLEAVDAQGDVDDAACKLVAEAVVMWARTKDAIRARAESLGIDSAGELNGEARCVSPSDFGFHNAIKASDGKIFFIDFEYAGWDDPAKVSGDFFFQPQVPVGTEHYRGFVSKVTSVVADPEFTRVRSELLRPVFGFKWCCIMLNAFIPEWSKRRTFADPATELPEMKARQLAKARAAYDSLKPMCVLVGA